MPKGGDIHLHYSGGVYTEVLIANALQYDMKLCEVRLYGVGSDEQINRKRQLEGGN